MKRLLGIGLMVAIMGFSLISCKRGHKSPEKQQKMMERIVEKISDKIELDETQSNELKSIFAEIKKEMVASHQKREEFKQKIEKNLEGEVLDGETVRSDLKLAIREMSRNISTKDKYVDLFVNFYNTLSVEQKKEVTEIVKDKLDWIN